MEPVAEEADPSRVDDLLAAGGEVWVADETALRDIASGESSRRQRTASLVLSEGLAA